MRVTRARIEPGPTGVRLIYSTGFGRDRVRDLSDDEAELVMAGAVIMKALAVGETVSAGGVLFEDQLRQMDLPAESAL